MKTHTPTPQKDPQAQAVEFAGFGDWFEIFTAGNHVDSKGMSISVSNDDLDSIVSNFTSDTAPLVIGHPKQNHPAYGWTSDLKREGNVLLAKASNVISEFEESVKKRMFPKRSVSIVPVEGGGFRLRHIGFLGAVPPAIKGLKDIAFNEDDAAIEFVETIELPARQLGWGLDGIARIFRSFRDHLIEKESLEVADRIVPDYQITELTSLGEQIRESAKSASMSTKGNLLNQFNEPTPPNREIPIVEKTFTQEQMDAALAEQKNKTTQLEKQVADNAFAAKVAAARTFVQEQVKDGKLTPALAVGMAEFMASLPDDKEVGFEFSEGEGDATKQVKMSQAEYFKKLLSGSGKVMNFGEQHGDNDAGTITVHEFAAADGASVSQERAAIHSKAVAYQQQHNCDYAKAVKAVS